MLLDDDIGAPQPPEISLGVICAGAFPNSTFDGAACACTGAGVGSGAPQGLLSLPEEPHGSNNAELVGTAAGALTGVAAGAGCEDRLKAELKALLLLLLLTTGDVTFAGVGLGGETGVELANPPKSSLANKSCGIDAATGLVAGFGGGGEVAWIFDVNEKSNPFELEGEVTLALGAGAFEGRLSKKLPPIKGGGEVT